MHLAASQRGRTSGTVLAETRGPPGPNPQGPEPGRGKRRLDECARCQVWCACVPVSWESRVNRHKDGRARACVDAKVGLCVPGCGSVWTVLRAQDARGAYTDSRACA